MTAAALPAPLSVARRAWLRNAVVLLLVAAVLSVLWVFAPNFFKFNNLINFRGFPYVPPPQVAY